MSEAVDRKGRVIGRVAVDRTIRLRTEATDPSSELAQRPAEKNLTCSRCGTVVCEGSRVKLFAGIVLTCNGCGEQIRG